MFMKRLQKRACQIGTGGVCLGWLQSLELVDYGDVFVSTLTLLIQFIISSLFGVNLFDQFFLGGVA